MARILLLLLTATAAFPQTLDEKVRAAIKGFEGTVSVYARNLDSGRSYGLREDDPVRTASTIKLPVLAAVYQAVESGQAQWTETLLLREEDKVSGSGVVKELSAGLRLPLRDLAALMIVVSDNTATNLILDRFTGDWVNAYLAKAGFAQTRSMRKILGDGKNLKPGGRIAIAITVDNMPQADYSAENAGNKLIGRLSTLLVGDLMTMMK